MGSLVDLDDPRSEDPSLSGAKASRLARARRLGLPVLPGFIVPADRARAALEEGRRALAAGGPARARLAVTRLKLPEGLAGELSEAGRRLGSESLIVRSSALEEGENVWAGAFASSVEVHPDELASALRACWASAFTPQVLHRCEWTRVRVEDLNVAALVQPQVRPDSGGIAVRLPDGSVSVVAARGSPAALLSGLRAGVRARVAANGTIDGGGGPLDASAARRVAALLKEVEAATGHGHIEWAAMAEVLMLLQLQPAPEEDAPRPPPVPDALGSETALRVARLVQMFGGPVGETLVLPWALGTRDLPRFPDEREQDPGGALKTARARARELAAVAWSASPEEAAARAAETLGELRGMRPERALVRIDRLRPVPQDAARGVLAQLAAVGASLAKAGVLKRTDDLWRLRPEELEELIDGKRKPPLDGGARPRRWAPFFFGVAARHGSPYRGVPASPGTAAGELRSIRAPSDLGQFPPGAVLVATHPVPELAPLLWKASGLVTWSGSPAAHLVHVAQSLGVPAVVGCPLEGNGTPLSAVDGDSGMVWVTAPS